jgi:hypothetical protein
MEVFNVAGKMVASIQPRATSDVRRATNYTWSPQTSPNGTYIIKVDTGDKVHTKSVTLIK